MSDDPVITPREFVSAYRRLIRQRILAPTTPAPLRITTELPPRRRDVRCALLFMPHPDDECLVAALPLRLKNEQGWHIINVAVTLGSNLERRAGRRRELAQACAVLGFDCVLPQEDGFSAVSLQTQREDAPAWERMVARLSAIIDHYAPAAVFMPHAEDWNTTHLGTHALVIDALHKQPTHFSCDVFQTEYWQPLREPNRMVAVSESDAALMLSGLSCHREEVARNPYDREFIGFLNENVRRGSERIGGKGSHAQPIDFAMMYLAGTFRQGRLIPSALKRILPVDSDVRELVPD